MKTCTVCKTPLDRISPELGYIVGNVQIISLLANTMKNEANASEMRQFAEWALRMSASVERRRPA